MAAPAKKMVGVSDDSSSSDDEELKRCQEAVWEAKPVKTKDGESNAKESKRVVVADHEHDGNELQVTKGFQTHVAKKLGHFLESCISEIQSETSSYLKSANCEVGDDDEDKGFRLFSTSIPGQKADEPPPPVRRRPIPSSSDSDSDSEMETRLKEAAVSVRDLIPSSALPSTLSPPSATSVSLERIKKKKKMLDGEEAHVKKKKKQKQNKAESEQVDSAAPNQSNSKQMNSEQEHTEVKRKRKKKRKENTEENN